ncbi:MAG: AAA family ATPase [Planctomycetaceae bacterium]
MTDRLELLIRSGYPLISLETADEERAVLLVRLTAESLSRPLAEWSLTKGLWLTTDITNPRNQLAPPGKPVAALEHVRHAGGKGIFVFHDLGPHTRDPHVHRLLRDLQQTCQESKTTVVLIESLPLPPDIRRLSVRYEIGWPTAEEIEQIVRETYQRIRQESLHEVTSRITKREMEQLVQTLRGLTCREAERVVATAIYQDYSLRGDDISRIVDAKRMLLGTSGCLESIAADFSTDEIGGLDNLKGWLRQRRGGFSQKAKEFGVEPPRGVLMLGVQGCGKSLCAKVIAADWKMPLLRLDPGVLYQKYIGESESRLRDALAQAEAMAPVVLWVDEIEKAFASAAADSSDGGLSQRMFGTLLTWMQDHRHPIFLVATANDISRLPPELMRKGRFDEIFFIDLPSPEIREQILAIHLSRRGRDPSLFDLPRLAAASEGYSGAELEQIVRAGLYGAFADGTELETNHLLAEMAQTRSLAAMLPERIEQLRSWARQRCIPAD